MLAGQPGPGQDGQVTWTAPAIERDELAYVGDERTILESYLDWHRQTLLLKCAGLTADQLKQASVEPSNLTLLGLVRHMSEVERSWFLRRVSRRDDRLDLLHRRQLRTATSMTWPTPTPRPTSPASTTEVEAARQAAAGVPLEFTFVGTPAARHQPALGVRAHDRGVRPAQRPCRPDP
jgi:hypothetical protein